MFMFLMRFYGALRLLYLVFTHGPVDIQRLARRHRPPPANLADYMAEFVKVNHAAKIDHVEVIASALDLDAHPPGMHFFTPASTFDTFYAAALLRAGADFQAPTIREAFVRIAVERCSRSSAEAHLHLLRKYQVAWMGCYSKRVPSALCALHESRGGHRCPVDISFARHASCSAVNRLCATRHPWRFQIVKCPLCRMHCDTWIALQPPTAGSRVLRLGGSLEQKMAVAQFLRELQALADLTMSPLRDRFDVSVGSDIGAFFVQMMVTERWDLADCVYHLPRVTAPRLRAGNTVVSYGKNLDWELRRVEQFNGPRVVIDIQGRAVSNGAATMSADRALSLAQATTSRSPDVVVECLGDTYDAEYLRTAAAKMTASLFYIELRRIPTFSSGQAVARVELQCRLQTGPPLFILSAKLRQQNAQLHYRGGHGKKKALYVNPVYMKRIVGFDEEESDYLLRFLFDHIAKRQELQCRIRYEAGTVLVWYQRVTHHSQTLDYPTGERRHAFRLTPLANKPIPALVEEDDGECAKDEAPVQLDLC